MNETKQAFDFLIEEKKSREEIASWASKRQVANDSNNLEFEPASDKEIGLVYFRKRYYDPEIGRWTSLDPLGESDGPNLYAYVKNNPIAYIDLHS